MKIEHRTTGQDGDLDIPGIHGVAGSNNAGTEPTPFEFAAIAAQGHAKNM